MFAFFVCVFNNDFARSNWVRRSTHNFLCSFRVFTLGGIPFRVGVFLFAFLKLVRDFSICSRRRTLVFAVSRLFALLVSQLFAVQISLHFLRHALGWERPAFDADFVPFRWVSFIVLVFVAFVVACSVLIFITFLL